MSEKVYCRDCKYHWASTTIAIHFCSHPDCKVDTPISETDGRCNEINKQNDCKYYEEKPPKPLHPPGFLQKMKISIMRHLRRKR